MCEAAFSSGSNSSSLFFGSQSSVQASVTVSATIVLDAYGSDAVMQAAGNLAADMVADVVNGVIDSLPMPDFMKDMAQAQVEAALPDTQGTSTESLEQMVETVLNDVMSTTGALSAVQEASSAMSALQDASSAIADMAADLTTDLMSQMQDSGESGQGNWLAILARSLGKTAGEHLKKMVELGEKMGSMDSKENPEAFAQTQAEFQAESQIFKMFQEAVSTMIKSIGDGMSSVSRRQ